MYIAALFTWTFINSTNTKGLRYDPKYWANRCGHIAGSQLPLMTALGMKNNLISALTGVSFDWLQILHRTCARVLCVVIWVHAFGRVYISVTIDLEEHWFRLGIVAASSLTLLSLLSIRPLRSRNHEVFLYLHAIFAIITLSGAYIHVSDFGYGSYIWPSLFLWGLDRFLRLLRISLVNSQLFGSTTRIASEATVTLPSSDAPGFIRVLVDRPRYFFWRPGQTAYLTIAGAYPTSISEAHPFTIANTPGTLQCEVPTESEQGQSSSGGRPQLMFILRVRQGFTRRLADSVLATGTSDGRGGIRRSFNAFVDGPYSSPPVVRGFETVVFICGGSGITFVLPLFSDLLQAASAATNSNPCCQRIVLIWAIRDQDQINWISLILSNLLSALPSANNSAPVIDIRFHVTSAAEDTQSFEGEKRPASSASTAEAGAGGDSHQSSIMNPEKIHDAERDRLLGLPGVQLIQGRPNVGEIVDTEITDARGGSMSVNVCGTPELGQSVRLALRSGFGRFTDVLRGGPSVQLHVEAFDV
ncbi:Ferric/cupric reductase transmembrane component 1 [Favolaschia claudopus]|uniref:Ferric/cupric reductase transmembrane component 1 n=1 Tax=Favolaschia claudopus TaxID=2862362 RepID=A0AAW0AYV0_9AGAR